MAKKIAELTPEELKAKRSASAKKAAATRAANKAKREAEAAASAKPKAKATKAKSSAKAKAKSKPVGKVIADALVAEDADAPTVKSSNPNDLDEGPGERIDHAAFAESDELLDYDEPFETDPNAPDAELDAEARALVNGAVKKSKKDKKSKSKKSAEKPKASKKSKKEKKSKKAKAREAVLELDTYPAKEASQNGNAGQSEHDNSDGERLNIDKREGSKAGKTTFAELGLIEPLQRAVADMGFEHPTTIQEQAIPILLGDDTDLVGLAQTGTGKTAAFGLPALHRLHIHTRVPQVLVLAPTRELCLQITVELNNFAKHMQEVDIAAVYGGADIVRQIKQIRRGVQVIAATPGRLRDLIRRRAVDLQHVRYLVLDEADEMLNMGFKEEIDDILTSIPDSAHTWLFSATMPSEVRRIAAEYMDNPQEVQSGERNSANANISHRYVITKPRERFPVLRRFLDFDPDMYGLVFVRTRADAKDFAEKLSAEGYNVDALHGDLSQAQRDNVMARFRNRRLQVLVATDVAARGIDVTGITHVFHLNLPDDLSFYTHRSGRTGRAGAEGISLALVHPKDTRRLRQIERIIKARFEEVQIPGGEQIIERRLLSSMRRLKDVDVAEGLDAYLPAVEEVLEGFSREDLIKRVASRSFEKLFNVNRFAPDLYDRRGRDVMRKSDRRDDRDDRPRRDRGGDENMERLFVNVGGMDVGGRKGNLLAMICDASGITGRDIGRITMNKTHTFFDVDKSVAKQVVERLSELHFDGRPVRINPADGPESSGGGGGRFRDDRGGRGDYDRRGGGRSYDRGDRHGGGKSYGGKKGKKGRW